MIAARQCMRVWECVFGLIEGACALWLLRGDACVFGRVCLGLYKGMLTVIAARQCMRVLV